MKEKTFKIIHDSLQQALCDPQTKTLLDALENFREILNSSVEHVPEEDIPTFYRFIDGLRASYYYRWKQSEFSNFMRNQAIALAYIIAWFNETISRNYYDEEASADISVRLKSAMSDWRKILDKSIESDLKHQLRYARTISDLSSTVRDRIGERIILEVENTNLLFKLYETILDILGGHNPKTKKEFIKWYENRKGITPSSKRAIRESLEVAYSVSHYKNYVEYPKKNGYKTLQFTMSVQSYSFSGVPGLQFEIQLRTKAMDEVAVSGSASHELYKKAKTVYKVISIDDPTITLRIKKGLEDFIPLCHCRVEGTSVEIID